MDNDSLRKDVILIVDDNSVNLDVLFTQLDAVGFKVLVAENGLDAIEQAKHVKPDLILLDVMMPGIDGFETCRQLKKEPATEAIPVIYMTALSDIRDKVRGFAVGAVDYVTKPVQNEELMARLTTHLTLRKLQKQLQESNNQLEQRVAQRTAELAQANTDLQIEIGQRQLAYDKLHKTNVAYSRFVPKELLRLLDQDSIVEIQLGDQVQLEMTVMFADIRNFTNLSEQMKPKENFDFLNSYLGRVSPIIRRHFGFIDKYIGDAIMALFPGEADDGVRAAIAMQQEVNAYNLERQAANRQPIKIGIGLHTGKIMLGTIGEAERMEGTVISDTVNQASRIERLTKHYGAAIILSDDTLGKLNDLSCYNFRQLGPVKVKGKRETISAFEILDGNKKRTISLKLQTRSDFEQGLTHFKNQEFVEAQTLFENVLACNPQDLAANLYLQQIQQFKQIK